MKKEKTMFLIQCSTEKETSHVVWEVNDLPFAAAVQQMNWEIGALNAGPKEELKYSIAMAWSENWF